jgi:phosphoadenosine phosphosulfate reductase
MTNVLEPKYSKIAGLLPSLQNRVNESKKMIEKHYQENLGYVAWSGGKDSTSVVFLATMLYPDIPIVWFDSGLEFPENKEYIFRLAEQYSFNLKIFSSDPDALTFLKESGFWNHTQIFEPTSHLRNTEFHEVLVTRPSEEAHDAFGLGELLGMRASESKGRKVLLSTNRGVYERKDGAIVCCPIWRWENLHVEGFLSSLNIEENPVYIKLKKLGAPEWSQRVGIVVDGNAAEYGRYTWLRAGWPDLWNELCQVLPRLREWR